MASKSKQKKKQAQKQKPLLLNPVFYIFLLLIVVVTNLRYYPALDKELEVRVLGMSLFVLAFGLLALMRNKNQLRTIDIKVLKNPFVILYGTYILLTGISIFVADNTAEALHEFLKLCAFSMLFLYLLLFVLPKERSRDVFLKTAVLLSLVVGVIAIYQGFKFIPEYGYSVKTAYLIKGNFAHKNIFSEIAFVTFAFAAYGIYYFRGLWRKAAVLGSVLVFLTIILLVTRAVWVAMLVSTVVTLIVYKLSVAHRDGKALLSRSVKLIFAGILLLGITTVAIFVKLDSNSSIKKHVIEATDFTSGNTYHRLNIWKKSIPIVKEHPLIGVGAGNWKIEVSKYNVALYYNNRGWVVPRRTHNDYINVITETGILGLIAFLAMFGVLIFYLIKLIRKSEHRSDALFYSILFFVLIGYMTFSFFNFTKERIETQVLMNVLFAFVVFGYRNISEREHSNVSSINGIRVVGIVALIPVLFAAYSSQQRLKTEATLNKVYALASKNSQREIDYSYHILKNIYTPFVSLSPMNDPIPSLQAITMLRKKMDKKKVVAKYKEALNVFPYHVRTLSELAYVYTLENNIDSALYYNGLALQYAPDNRKVFLDQVVYLRKDNRSEEAFELLSKFEWKNQDERFRKMLHAFLKQKIVDLLADEKNKIVVQQAINYGKSQKAMMSLFRQSQKGKHSFDKLFLMEIAKRVKKNNPKDWKTADKSLFKKHGVKV